MALLRKLPVYWTIGILYSVLSLLSCGILVGCVALYLFLAQSGKTNFGTGYNALYYHHGWGYGPTAGIFLLIGWTIFSLFYTITR